MNPNSSTDLSPRQTILSSQFINSAPQENNWIQLSLSRDIGFPSQIRLIDGMYVIPIEEEQINPELTAEFEAWETASDEALLNFESRLMDEEG
jgi:hypothetical protein